VRHTDEACAKHYGPDEPGDRKQYKTNPCPHRTVFALAHRFPRWHITAAPAGAAAIDMPELFDWEQMEILGAINGYEYMACETSDWITSEVKAFCDRLRKLAESHLPNASDATWTISPGDMPLHKRSAAGKRANRA